MIDTMAPEKKLTDDRLGDLDKKVDVGFAQVGKDFEKMDLQFAQVAKEFKKVDERFDKVDKRFEKVNERFGTVEGKIEGGFKELRREMNELGKELRREIGGLRKGIYGSASTILITIVASHFL
jgi:hypothetical protein